MSPRTALGGMTLLILVALAFSTAGGQGELIKAALPGGSTQGFAIPEQDRAQAQVATRQVRRVVRDQDFRTAIAARQVRTAASSARDARGLFSTPGLTPRLLRADLLSLPPPAV